MNSRQKRNATVKEIAVFGMLGALMYASKVIMELVPNVHFLGTFIVAMTIVYRKKALYPIYIFVFLTGLLNGFGTWWIPYLYIWAILWGVTMLLPKNMSRKKAVIVYCIVCSLHGFLYGTLYAPFQAIMYNLNFEGTIAWIAAGLPYDAIHGVGNLICGILIVPLSELLLIAEKTVKKT
jgi:energy-coupling factor transport system substrate-specific component